MAPLQICYVLVAKGWDRHAQMMWLSATSLRFHEPDARITLLTDRGSLPALEREAPQLLALVNNVVAVDSSIEDRRLRAFGLKTSLRNHVNGDLLYLDGDTLVVSRLGDALLVEADVAAALDFNHDGEWFPPQLKDAYVALGWPYPLPYYFNSGVLLLRDTLAVHDFSREWTRRWQLLVEQGLPGDQEALVTALYAMPVKWARLAKGFNSIVVKRNYRFKEARILHFFGSRDEQRGTLMEFLLDRLQETGAFDEQAYWTSVRQGHAWGPRAEPWQLWRSRNYVRAIVVKARRTIARGLGLG